MAGVEGALASLKRDNSQGTGAGHAGAGHAGAGPIQSEDGVSPQNEKPQPKPRVRRDYPDLVTREAAEDDADVFGEAWPLIVEWRGLKDSHLLREAGWRGFDRSGQITWRRSALSDTRRERERAELLNKVTFGRLWK